MSIEVQVCVNVQESIRRGKPSQADRLLTITDADVASLTSEEREQLAGCLYQGEASHSTNYKKPPLKLYVGRFSVPEATFAGIVEAVRNHVAAVAKEATDKAAQEERRKIERREATLAVLRNRKTETRQEPLYMPGKEPYIVYDVLRPDWPYYGDDEIKQSPEAVAWIEELNALNLNARADAEARKERRLAEIETAKAQKEIERLTWIAAHGSERLKRCMEEEIEYEAIYKDERLAVERPGWIWTSNAVGEINDPRNPPVEAFAVLDEARKTVSDATLSYWTVERDEDDYVGEDDDKYAWTGYVALSEFLGRMIVYGLPAEYIS